MNPYLMVAITILFGLLAGGIGGLLGVGGGIVMVPCFRYFLKFNMHQAVGTSLAVISVATLAGAVRHIQAGNVQWKTAAIIVLFVAAGSYFGAELAQKVPKEMLQRFFGVWMVGVGIYMLVK